MDRLSREQRSRNMARIRSRDTRPELVVRRLVHSMGFRFRLHRQDLPGRPDLVFPSRRKVIFVHGCFWHRHSCRRGKSLPTTRVEFWTRKFEANRQRDDKVRRELRRDGWEVLVVWECQATSSNLQRLANRIRRFLDDV